MTWKNSLQNFLIGTSLGSILFVSYLLTPDARGYGTHEHLFLPPCYFKYFLNISCPACGLTTAFAYLAKGQLFEAFHTHWMSPLIFILFVFLFLYSLICLVRGKSFWSLFQNKWVPTFSSFIVLGMLLCWIVKLVHNDSNTFMVRSIF